MNKRMMKLLVFGIASIFICVMSVNAIKYVAFTFHKVGDYQEVTEYLNAGDLVLKADLFETGNATMGLSLSKSGIFGWTFISRCNNPIIGEPSTSCTWKEQSQRTYRGTAVLNTKDSSFTGAVSGQLSLYKK